MLRYGDPRYRSTDRHHEASIQRDFAHYPDQFIFSHGGGTLLMIASALLHPVRNFTLEEIK
jgi:hypothetical protein